MAFDPTKLSKEDQEAVVEQYLGIHPRYFAYSGLKIKIQSTEFERNNPTKKFIGWEQSSLGDPQRGKTIVDR